PQNDVTLKMPAFEWVHVQLHQQKGMISLSPPTICNSALLNNVKSVEFLMTHRNSLFDHEKSPRELSGDILEWFKGDITAWC
uniref:hypothetical protein n=1 Tax=Enterobacter hormaechei TaxID=158836 RepID=UPI003D6FA957